MKFLMTVLMTMTMTSAFAADPACAFNAECSEVACKAISGTLVDKKCVNPKAGETDNTQCGAIVSSGAPVNKADGKASEAAAAGKDGATK